MNCKLKKMTSLPDVTNFDVITSQSIFKALKKVFTCNYSSSFFFPFKSRWDRTLEIVESYFSSWNQNWDFIILYLQAEKRANSCLLGHVSGLVFRLYFKLFLPSYFNSVEFWRNMFWTVLDISLADINGFRSWEFLKMQKFTDAVFVLCPPKNV